MFQNYSKRFSITSYGEFYMNSLTGFEEVVVNGVARYYVINYNNTFHSDIVIFDQNWILKDHRKSNALCTYSIKYVERNFYFSSLNYFYKTTGNSQFTVINTSYCYLCSYRQIVYDLKSSKFYLPLVRYKQMDIYDTSCTRLQRIDLDFKLNTLALYNNNFYCTEFLRNKIFVLANNSLSTVTKKLIDSQCLSGIRFITVDSFGYIAIICSDDYVVLVYDLNGTDMNTRIISEYEYQPYFIAIDSKRRLLIMTMHSFDIYY